MPKNILLITAAGMAMASASAVAQDRYVSVNVGFSLMADSKDAGTMNEDFVLGLGAGGLGEGAAYRLNTSFAEGFFGSVAVGKSTIYGPFRSELEFSYTRNDTSDHSQLRAFGDGNNFTNLDPVDVGTLAQSATPVGLTNGRVLSNAQGNVSTMGFMVNSYYDLVVPNSDVHPFVGIGIGALRTSVDYDPSGLGFVDDSAWSFGYQLMAGVDYDLTSTNVLHVGFRYRAAAGGVEVETDGFENANVGPVTFNSDLEVEVEQFIAEIGYIWKF